MKLTSRLKSRRLQSVSTGIRFWKIFDHLLLGYGFLFPNRHVTKFNPSLLKEFGIIFFLYLNRNKVWPVQQIWSALTRWEKACLFLLCKIAWPFSLSLPPPPHFGPGYLYLDIMGLDHSLLWGAILCIIECLAASLASRWDNQKMSPDIPKHTAD